MAKIKVNDQPQELPDGTSVTTLLALNKVPQSDMVSVQLNGDFVLREDYESTVLKDNDEVDFLYFMGGGR
jgi:sulfur carrier protein